MDVNEGNRAVCRTATAGEFPAMDTPCATETSTYRKMSRHGTCWKKSPKLLSLTVKQISNWNDDKILPRPLLLLALHSTHPQHRVSLTSTQHDYD